MGSLATIHAATDAAPVIDLADVRRRLTANRTALAGRFWERADILQGLDVAAVAAEHVLMVSPPGTAKSDLARTWAAQFAGVYREDLFTRQSTEADHLAYLDVGKFSTPPHVYVYKTEGKITEAHFAFADECFKATGGFLNALLGWLNERSVRGGHVSPLITCVAASNEFGEDESVAALEDRLLIRYEVTPIGKRANRLAFLAASAQPAAPLTLEPITVDEIRAAHVAARSLPVDALVVEAVADVQDALRGAGVYVSDRRARKCIRILQAYAWVTGSATVEIDHVDFLRDVLWRRPEDKPAVQTALGAVNRGMIGEIKVIVTRLLDMYHEAKGQADFPSRAARIAEQLDLGGREIKAKYGGRIPDAVKERAKGYLGELRSAYEHCKQVDAKLPYAGGGV
jgi:MoxR-like ATPase